MQEEKFDNIETGDSTDENSLFNKFTTKISGFFSKDLDKIMHSINNLPNQAKVCFRNIMQSHFVDNEQYEMTLLKIDELNKKIERLELEIENLKKHEVI